MAFAFAYDYAINKIIQIITVTFITSVGTVRNNEFYLHIIVIADTYLKVETEPGVKKILVNLGDLA